MTLSRIQPNRTWRPALTVALAAALFAGAFGTQEAFAGCTTKDRKHTFKWYPEGNLPPDLYFTYGSQNFARTNSCKTTTKMGIATYQIGAGLTQETNSAGPVDSYSETKCYANIGALGVGFVSGTYGVINKVCPELTGCGNPPFKYGVARAQGLTSLRAVTKNARRGKVKELGKWDLGTVTLDSQRRVGTDPVIARLRNLDTGEVYEYKLMSFQASAGNGTLTWDNDTLSNSATNMTLDLHVGAAITVEQGDLRISVESGIITTRVATGIFSTLAIPPLGGSGTFAVALPEIEINYDFNGILPSALGEPNEETELEFSNEFEDEAAVAAASITTLITSLNTPMTTGGDMVALSELNPTDSTLGVDVGVSRFHIADSFTVPAGAPFIPSALTWPVYQQNASPSMPLAAAFVRIWRGTPGAGGTPVAGDMSTNRLMDVDSTNAYRVSMSNPGDHSRSIKNAVIDMSWAPPLNQGVYYIEFACEGFNGQNLGVAMAPPSSWKSGQQPTTAARRFTVQTNQWTPVLDNQSQRPLHFPFQIHNNIPVPPPCPTDINHDGVTNVADLLAVINSWGQQGGPADVNHDGNVNVLDMLAVINAWGACGGSTLR